MANRKVKNSRVSDGEAGNWPDAILLVNEQWQVRSVNHAAAELFGYESTELQNIPLNQLLDVPAGTGQTKLRTTANTRGGIKFPVMVSLSAFVTPGRTDQTIVQVAHISGENSGQTGDSRHPEQADMSTETLAALDLLDDHVVIFDREFRYLFANASVLKSNGMVKSEVLGRRYWEVFPEVVGTPFDKAVRRAFDSPDKITLEHRHLRGKQWHQVEIVPSKSTLTVRARDITGPKRTEELNQRLIASLDSIADPILVMDRQMTYMVVNTAASGFIGRPRHELLGQNVWELSPWLMDTPFGRACVRALDAAKPFSIEDHYQPRDRWLQVHYFPGQDGFTVHITDVTDLKLSRERVTKLVEERGGAQQLRKAFDLMPHPMLMVDAEFRYTYANAAAREPNARTEEEMIGARLWDINPGLADSDLVDNCRMAFGTQQRQQFELLLPPAGRWFQMEAIPWRDQLILSAVDISLLKKSQESVGILTDTLDQAMDAGWNRPTARDSRKPRRPRS